MYQRTSRRLLGGMTYRFAAVGIAALMLFVFPSPLAQAEASDAEVISYHVGNKVPDAWGVQRAIRMWNRVDAGQPRFVRVSRPWAEVTIRRGDATGSATGHVLLPATRGESLEWGRVVLSPKAANAPMYRGYRHKVKQHTTVHELGHVLGLGHVSDRSVMGNQRWWVKGGQVTGADVRRLRNLY